MTIVAWIFSRLGIAGCLLLGLWIYEEGIPFASYLTIPKSVWVVGGFGIGDVPVIGQLTTGHVQTYAAQQVRLATAQMVSQAELTASKAENFELKRQLDASSQALADNEKQQADDEAAAKAKDAQTALDITEYENRIAGLKRQWTLDANDVKFFNTH